MFTPPETFVYTPQFQIPRNNPGPPANRWVTAWFKSNLNHAIAAPYAKGDICLLVLTQMVSRKIERNVKISFIQYHSVKVYYFCSGITLSYCKHWDQSSII